VLLLLLGAGPLQAQTPPAPGEYRVSLLTYGPGEIYWQRFGHNAIRIHEPGRSLDHAFNFGFFSFEQESFLLRFVQGRMLYFAAAVPTEREIQAYRSEGREIREQQLDLTPDEYLRLRDHLLWHVQPENREYLYDYYLDNCSTRLRDALDLALDGALRDRFAGDPAGQTFRDHTRRSTAEDYWYQLGLQLALGRPVDRPIDRWREAFLPAELARLVTQTQRPGAGGSRPLVTGDRILYPGLPAPPATPAELWPRYLAPALALVLLGWLLRNRAEGRLTEALTLAWLMTSGSLGLLLIAVWLFTDHGATHPNLNLLLLMPFALLGFWPRARRPAAALLALAVGVCAVFAIWPAWQYLRDVFAVTAPLTLGSAAWLWHRRPPPAARR
jgi:hypothetical protein